MTLPSRYAREGLSLKDQHRTITSGKHTQTSSYRLRVTEKKETQVNAADGNEIQEIEMDEVHEMDEPLAFTEPETTHTHDESEFNNMELDTSMLRSETVSIRGNMSYLVIDTNFILAHLSLLNDLKDFGRTYLLVIIIPNEVIRELDGLKNSTRTENGHSVGKSARKANDWIYYCLAEGIDTVRGQAPKERLNKLASGDDAILDCCVFLQQHCPMTLQVLMSDDKNLCMKALLSQILTISYRERMSARDIAEKIYSENINKYGELSGQTLVREVEVPVLPNVDLPETIIEKVYHEIEIIVVSIVKRAISEEYGADLDILVGYSEEQIVSLQAAEQAMIRFWLPVFSNFLPRTIGSKNMRNHLEPTMYSEPTNMKELAEFVELWTSILHLLYKALMTEDQLKSLELLVERWTALAHS